MREKQRLEIRKKRNEEIFYRNRIQTHSEYQEVMKYLEFRNEEQEIPNLRQFIENKSQHIHECVLITKWLLEYERLEDSQCGIQIYFFCQNEIALNFENEYIKLSAKLLRKLCLKDEAALTLCTKLSSRKTLRAEPFIQELQSHQNFINELMDSQFDTVELICNLMYGEAFVLEQLEKEGNINFFREHLYNQKYSTQVILMYQSISSSSKICELIISKDLIQDLMQLNPSPTIFQLLLKLAQNSELFWNHVDMQLIDYLMEMITFDHLQDSVFILVYVIFIQTHDRFLKVGLQFSKNIIEQIAKNNPQLYEYATEILEILDQYIINS